MIMAYLDPGNLEADHVVDPVHIAEDRDGVLDNRHRVRQRV
jgi:hypothetical protein